MSCKTITYKNAAFAPEASVFVSANAGAGKTSLLVRRVLALLLSGVAPSRVLCLTFTNAAAAEMSNRVLAELGRWVMMEDADLSAALSELLPGTPQGFHLARARSLFALTLETPDGLKMQTIHGFCQSLLRRFPVEAAVSPHFTVMDERSEQELLHEARLRLFTHAREADTQLQVSIDALARDLSEIAFNQLLSEIIVHKRRFYTLLTYPGGVYGAVAALQENLGVDTNVTTRALWDQFNIVEDSARHALTQIACHLKGGSAEDGKRATIIEGWLKDADFYVEQYLSLFITQEGTARQKLFTQKGLKDDGLIRFMQEEQQRAMGISEKIRSLEMVQHTAHLLCLAEGLLAIYNNLKLARATMDYDDLILNACALLKRPGISPWVLYKLDGGIDHVLVDEAQDTSPEQWQIVDALTQDFFVGAGARDVARSLFVVGDEKQSIFSFQGADVKALAKMQRYFIQRIKNSAHTAQQLYLTHSFRSTREVLAVVDTIFTRDEARAGLMFDDGALSHTVTRHDAQGLVELWPLITSDDDVLSPVTRCVRHIADTIKAWIGQGVRPGDIMILVRKRAPFAPALVRALKRRNIPVGGIDRMALNDNLAVQDLIALGQVLLLPEDDLSLAAVLKSPIFNISEEELFAFCHGRGEKTVWQRLQEKGGVAYELLADLRARADFISPFALYSYLLDTLGARRRFTGRMGEEYADAIDEFLMQALLYEQGHTPSLQGFIHWLTISDSEIKRDMEQSQNQVRVMTVYGAKGLQAPIVILPDTTEPPSLNETLLWDGALPLWPRGQDNALTRRLRAEQKEAMLAEYRRLLYVALTRAEDRLYICGATSKEKINEQSWYHLVHEGLKPIAQPFETRGGQGLRVGKEVVYHPDRGERSCEEDSSASPQNDQFLFLQNPPPPEPLPTRPLSPSTLPGDDPVAASPLGEKNIFQRGNFIHKLLQHLPAIPEAKQIAVARQLAKSYSLREDNRDEAIRETLAVINGAEFSAIFSDTALAEAPVAGTVVLAGKPVTISGQIDRLAVTEKEVWIVDFKTNRQPPVHRADTPAQYLRQLMLYKRLIAGIYPDQPIRCALLWTAAPRMDVIDDALLDEVMLSSYI